MPTASDLVTDLPADFETFGQAVATSMADLLGGTTGQILAKASNTDMDFTWIANDQGDITGVTASSPLTGGGTSGAITIGILNGTTSNLGAVQLSDSTSSTSTTLAATANAVKTTYDLANAAIPKSLIDAAGDLIIGTAADTAGRLAIGTNGQVLQSNGTTAVWATPAAGGATFVGAGIKKSANQSISNNTFTLITFNQEDFDTSSFHDNSTNNTRITIPTGKGGYYLITGVVSFEANVTGTRAVTLLKNGGSSIYLFFQPPNDTGSGLIVPFTYIAAAAAGDYFELEAYQASGTSLNVKTETNWQVQFLGA